MTGVVKPTWIKNRQYKLDFLILTLAAILTFYQSLNIHFLGDNISHIQQAWNNLSNTDYYYFRPVTILTIIIDRLIWGMTSHGYHLTNLILHLLNSVMVYLLAERIFSNRFISLSSSFLFLLHPIHSMNIFWISGRTDMVCSLFFVLSLLLFLDYIKAGNSKQLVFSLLCFGLALLAKEMAISLPLVITLYLIMDSQGKPAERITYSLRKSGLFYLTVLLFFSIKYILHEDVLSNVVHSNVNPVHITKNIAAYIGLLIIPGGHIELAALLKEYPYLFLLLSAGALILFALALWFWWSEKYLVYSILFILLTILPAARLLMRWYLYIPSIGFILALSFIINKLKWNKFKLDYISLVLVLVIYVGFLLTEQKRWIQAGQLAKEVTDRVSQVVKEEHLQYWQLLNLPAELEETPVLTYGFDEFMQYRLRQDFDYQKEVQMHVASHVSLANKSDMEKMKVSYSSDNEYRISLKGTDSFFVFPFRPEIISKQRKIQQGTVLSDSLTVITIEELSVRNEPVVISVKKIREDLPVLYFSNGVLHRDSGNSVN